MKFIADLHIHSRFSRATSKALDPEHLSLWARKKGIGVVGTGDFTHPGWVSELSEKLMEAPCAGLYQLKPDIQRAVDSETPHACPGPARFLLTGEISCIYKKNGRTRKLHHLILMPDMDAVYRFNRRLDRIGNIASDGRPILGLDSKELLEITLETGDNAFFIPAHIWTPWFSLFGSKSGFDAIEECFEELTVHIHALETGLSSDPPMNRRLSALDPYLLVSNSDAHSPGKLGREANLFDTHLDYPHMIQAMKTGKGFAGTIEFFPEEGKYHLDGHRKCGVRLNPEETSHLAGICPVCHRPLTVGVLNRIYELSDRSKPRLSRPFHSLIPLPEILSEILGCGPATRKATQFYEKLLTDLGPELEILMNIPLKRVAASGGPVLAEAIKRMRCNQVIRHEGYDGQFGTIHLFEKSEKARASGQTALFADLIPNPTSVPSPAPVPPREKPRPRKDRTTHTPASPADPVIDPLNPEQRDAVLHTKGHLLVAAGPGTGKTLTLTHRIIYLIREGRALPEQVLCLTFTRKAAREMGDRISRLLMSPQRRRIRVATFHRYCLDLLRKHGAMTGLPLDFSLCSEIDRERIARDILERPATGKSSLTGLLNALSRWRAEGVLDDPLKGMPAGEYLPLCREYQRMLRKAGMLDLDELEVEALRLLQDHPEASRVYDGQPIRWIFVDEYQDTNPVQVELLKRLVQGDSGHICAIGDPDQAIYGFRGADVQNFHRFSRDFPGAKEIVLTRNYRSAPSILKGSAAVIRRQHALIPESPGKGPIALVHCQSESEEAEMVVEQIERLIGGTSHFSIDSGRVAPHEGEGTLGFGDIGILYRLNAQGDALEEALDRAGIPLVRSGEAPLLSRYPANLLWRYFQALRYPGTPYYVDAWKQVTAQTLSFRQEMPEYRENDARIIDLLDAAVAALGIDTGPEETHRALERLRDSAMRCEGNLTAFLDALSIDRGIDHALLAGDRLALMSLHAAKGLEWEAVFIVGCEDRLLPCLLFGNRDLGEEARLFYVGMTRARAHLILSHVNRRSLHGRILGMKPSPFLDLIPDEVLQPLDRRGWRPRKRPARQLTLF